jgi:ribosomal protein S19
MKVRIIRSSLRKDPLLFVMIVGAFIAVLNQTIINVALPELMIGKILSEIKKDRHVVEINLL